MEIRSTPAIYIVVATCAIMFFASQPVWAHDTGPLAPFSVVNVTFSSKPWTVSGASLLADLSASDDVRATADVDGNSAVATDYLDLVFPISIPIQSIVDGVQLDIEGQRGSISPDPFWHVKASHDGGGQFIFTPESGNAPITSSGPTDNVDTAGGPTDRWRLHPTSGMLNGDEGGFIFRLQAVDIINTDDTFMLDSVSLTVFYTDAYFVGGTVSGLSGTELVLQNNVGDDEAITGNGTFTFGIPLVVGSTYAVTVKTQPGSPSQTCTVSNGSGTMASANITNVAVTCEIKPDDIFADGFEE